MSKFKKFFLANSEIEFSSSLEDMANDAAKKVSENLKQERELVILGIYEQNADIPDLANLVARKLFNKGYDHVRTRMISTTPPVPKNAHRCGLHFQF